MTKFYLVLFFTSLGVIANGQVLTIVDSESRQPLEFVTVASNDSKVFTMTNVRGMVEIDEFKNSSSIEIRYLGYKTVKTTYDALSESNFELEMTPSSVSLDNIVVSANRWKQPVQEIPSRVTSISPKDISLLVPQTAADLLEKSGEVFIQKSQQGGGSPMIRGFSTNRLLYTVDGVRMNTAIFRSGNLQNVISIDPLAMESAEVLFGPGSIIYGSDAIGGVMSFQTLTPQFSLESKNDRLISGKASTRYASANNEQTYHFDVNVGWNKWAILSSFTQNSFDDLRMGSNGPDEYLRPFYVSRHDSVDVVVQNDDPLVQRPTGYDQINLMQKVRFKPSEEWDISYGFHYSTTTDYARYDRHIQLRNGLPRSAKWNYGPQVWLMNNLTIENHSSSLLYDEATLRLAHQNFEESRISRGFNDPIQKTDIENVTALSANLDFLKNFGNNATFLYGLEAVTNEVLSRGFDTNIENNTEAEGDSRYPDATWTSYAVYVTYQYDFTPRLRAQGGLRYNQFIIDADFTDNLPFYPLPKSQAEINKGALTASMGLVYHSTDTWTISGNISTGFRSPNIDDIGKVFDSGDQIVVVPNADLNAEYAYNAELSVAKVFDDLIKIDLTGYYTYLNDAMVRRPFTLGGQDSLIYNGELSQVQAIQNAAEAEVYGIQAGLEVQLSGGFSLSSHFNYQKGKEEQKDGTISPSRHAAPWFGITRFKFQSGRLNLQVNSHYNGERSFRDLAFEERVKPYLYATDQNGNPYSPGWYTINFKSNFQLTEVFLVSAGVENITDQRYRPYSSGLVAGGRNLTLGLQARF